MNILLLFTLLSIINVIFSTIRSLVTIKSGKGIASVINGGYFAFYNVILIYSVAEFPMWQKCIITFACNVVGVYIVKLIEEKARKDKLWLVQATVKTQETRQLSQDLHNLAIPYNYLVDSTGQRAIFNIYCATQKESALVKEIINKYHAKYFVSESKQL